MVPGDETSLGSNNRASLHLTLFESSAPGVRALMRRVQPTVRTAPAVPPRPIQRHTSSMSANGVRTPVSPLARQVYKRLMWAARDYPGGPDKIRAQAKAAIRQHQHEKDPEKIKELMVRSASCALHPR